MNKNKHHEPNSQMTSRGTLQKSRWHSYLAFQRSRVQIGLSIRWPVTVDARNVSSKWYEYSFDTSEHKPAVTTIWKLRVSNSKHTLCLHSEHQSVVMLMETMAACFGNHTNTSTYAVGETRSRSVLKWLVHMVTTITLHGKLSYYVFLLHSFQSIVHKSTHYSILHNISGLKKKRR